MRSGMEISPKPNGNLAFGKVFGNIADKQFFLFQENMSRKRLVIFKI